MESRPKRIVIYTMRDGKKPFSIWFRGGDKSTQSKDIARAKEYLKDVENHQGGI